MSTNSKQLTVFRCAMCGKALIAGRSDKKTCSDSCRKKLSYHRKRILSLQTKALQSAFELLGYMNSTETQLRAQEAIAAVRTGILNVAHAANIKAVR